MDIDIQPSQLAGEVSAIASKSMAHRLLILAAFSQTSCDIDCNATSADIEATVRCLNALGAHIVRTKRGFRVTPLSRAPLTRSAQAPRTSQVTADPSSQSSSQSVAPDSSQLTSLDCGESGSTLRFLLPVVGALGCGARFIVHGRLSQRPLRRE
jgi:3-phosphoshikimate 1-carboxyvinyltransferase